MNRFLTIGLLLVSFPVTAAELTPEDLDSIPQFDVIVLGEVHDNPIHHQNQARAVRAIKPAALVFEMLSTEQAGKINDDNRNNADDLAAAVGWAEAGWPDFLIYFPVFKAGRHAAIRGGAKPRADVRRAVTEGAAVVFGAGGGAFALNTHLPDGQQKARENLQMEAHCNALPESLLAGMVEAQRLRDAALADAVIKAYAETGGPVVLITGNGHARLDWGVPAALKLAAPELTVFSLAQYEAPPEDPPPFDVYLVTEPAEREDPCAAFSSD